MHAELEVGRQAVRADGMAHDGDVGSELRREAGHVADVVDSLVEPAAEPGGDGPHGETFIGQGREDHEQFRRHLRRVRLVHRHLREERALLAVSRDAAVELPRRRYGVQVVARDALGHLV